MILPSFLSKTDDINRAEREETKTRSKRFACLLRKERPIHASSPAWSQSRIQPNRAKKKIEMERWYREVGGLLAAATLHVCSFVRFVMTDHQRLHHRRPRECLDVVIDIVRPAIPLQVRLDRLLVEFALPAAELMPLGRSARRRISCIRTNGMAAAQHAL
jgi:hypothetical protein